MPFVTREHRNKPDASIPGDMCYVAYARMVKRWKKEPRWTTAHEIYKDVALHRETCPKDLIIDKCDECAATELAWQVFFQFYVLDYERKKRDENGDI